MSGRKISDADANGRVSVRKTTFVGLIAGCVEVEVKLQAEEEGSQFGCQTSTFQSFISIHPFSQHVF